MGGDNPVESMVALLFVFSVVVGDDEGGAGAALGGVEPVGDRTPRRGPAGARDGGGELASLAGGGDVSAVGGEVRSRTSRASRGWWVGDDNDHVLVAAAHTTIAGQEPSYTPPKAF